MRKKLAMAILSIFAACSIMACGNDVIIDVVTNEGTNVGASTQAVTTTETSDTEEVVEAAAEGDASQEEEATVNALGLPIIPAKDLKIGVLYIGSSEDTSGYTYAHELGIQGMVANLGLSDDQVVRIDNINDGDNDAVQKALEECMDAGCNVVFTTSWGYMEKTSEFAEKYPDVYFAHGTGYMSNGKNFTNYFGRIYQARYLSGLVAGMKTQSNKIGYVSAMDTGNSECTGGIDAFALGVEKVNPDAKVYVCATNSWFDPEAEQAASEYLVKQGCDVLAQHVDTTAPQTVSEANGTWAIGYNSDMSKETPNATLTSVIWNWSAYYTSYVSSIMNGTYDGSNYYGGMDESLIGLTALSSLCDEDTAAVVSEMQTRIMTGEFGVFDGELETNTGDVVGAANSTLDDATITGGINWYYRNVEALDWN